ncbi:lytic transglycosylase domain-containing protein [Streptomyces bluensis]|uniref:lytic transglycosylase domain-containing protein n=1 Tax=Streptomyces bluensis TaxID=33897 RepID=UPI0016742636|nr:lytic transglycosylase domain-containing protein [Streptomyces bluensis]GGZ48691.1 lytic transglycosylase [Streptomyces bluensis]
MSAQFGKRLRKGAATTTVAAIAVAALAASQAPGVTTDSAGRRQATDASAPDAASGADDTATGNSRYYTDLPPLDSPTATPGTDGDTPDSTAGAERGIPATVLDAYKKAEAALRESKPGCNLPWQLLAAIGKVESGQARGGRVDDDGTTYSKILGPVLNGGQFANIRDTDNGAYDGDSTYDRAVGPMQFIPSTWEWAGRDGNGDGRKDPNNIYDAALAAGNYLCRFDWDLSDQRDLRRAILSYNNSTHYLNTVLSWLEYYRKGTHEVPDGTGTLPRNPSDGGTSGSSTNPSPSPRGTQKPTPPKDSADTPEPPGNPGTGGEDSGTPAPPSTPPGTTPPATTPPSTTPPTPTDTVDHLENAGTGTLTAMAGDAFAGKVAVRTETKAGQAVAKVRVRFTVVGDTDATFTGGESVATVVTDSAGTATAPPLQAGEKTGGFTVRATVVGREVPGLDFKATVTARQADALARTTDTALTCVPGGEFAEQVEVKATYKGGVADGVAATATLIKSVFNPAENDKGPYFKDADGKTVRTLTDLTTDKDGLLKLPKLYADDTSGTFLLRITTTGGATLTVELKVAAAESASPSPSA